MTHKDHQICNKCKVLRNLEYFHCYKDPSGKSKRRRICKECRNTEQKERYKKNPEIHRAYLYKTQYGITIEEYDQMVVNQGGRCKVCGTDTPNCHHKRFVVDHNHKTGVIRGLLCSTCNTGLGNFFDNPDTLLKAAQYLYTNGHYG
jgi:hypothetical protein